MKTLQQKLEIMKRLEKKYNATRLLTKKGVIKLLNDISKE